MFCFAQKVESLIRLDSHFWLELGYCFEPDNRQFHRNLIATYIQNTYLSILVYGLLIGITIGAISGAFVESMLLNIKPESKVSA